MFRLIIERPILFCFNLCLLLLLATGIFFNSVILPPINISYIFISAILIFCSTDFLHKMESIILCLIFFLIFILAKDTLFLLLGEIFSIGFVFWKRRLNEKAIPFFVIAIGFIFHLFYIQRVSVDFHQHDIGGILSYMSMITRHGFNFFDFDPWYMYYFFHQPLHFLIIGQIYLLEFKLWGSSVLANEGLQYLSLFYVTATTIVVARILRELSFKEKSFYSALILFTFNPTLFLFSGYIADDTPVLFWSTLFIYYLLRWYKSDDIHNIIYAAICFGCGTLTKLSILTLVPAVCCLFIYKIYTSSSLTNTLKGLSLFAIIAVPLSLIWIARNHILFDMQFYNIPDTSPWGQNFKHMTFGERIGDFSHIFEPFINAPLVADSNMFLALVKTELFGEWNLSLNHSHLFIFGFCLYMLNIIIKILSWINSGYIVVTFCKHKQAFIILFFTIIYFTIWFYSFKYALDYPFVCSSDYRLFANLILPEVIILNTLSLKNNTTAKLFFGGSIIYAFLSCYIYTFSI